MQWPPTTLFREYFHSSSSCLKNKHSPWPVVSYLTNSECMLLISSDRITISFMDRTLMHYFKRMVYGPLIPTNCISFIKSICSLCAGLLSLLITVNPGGKAIGCQVQWPCGVAWIKLWYCYNAFLLLPPKSFYWAYLSKGMPEASSCNALD